jgi:serine protease Do
VSQLEPGTAATLKVIRNGLTKTIVVTLGELPDIARASSNHDGTDSETTAHADMLDGVTVADIEPEIRQQLRVPSSIQGALVSEVDENSNSAEAGLKQGDIILEINKQPVADANDAVRLCKDTKDVRILLKVWRRTNGYDGTRYLSVDNTKR